MRDIIFRGKRVDNGEWVEGYYWNNEVGNYFIKVIRDKNNNFVSNPTKNDFEVDPKTIGQFTGLVDKNGNKIFENDVIMHCAENKLALVEFINGQFSIQKYGYWLPSSDNFEVIGNKFDNPEL